MHLRSLVVKGFKSFAETTRIDFEPGVSVIVGPNGSGKSNVVDAITWVLGAQSTRSLRSGKMEDVIFAGTSSRPALGRAEVSLVLDNSDGALALEFTEVTITRTLFRSGDSTYAINNVPCRLLDLQELLSDAGVGRQQHVIVAQGQIDAVLSARTEERRAVIEEAAGILKYRKRKEKAERRLAATEGNLLRLQDLLREVRRQLRPLARQAEAAQRHESLAHELRAVRLHLIGREIVALSQRRTAADDTMATVDGRTAQRRAGLAELDARIVEAESGLGGIDEDGSETLARLERLSERAAGVLGRVAERRRFVELEVDKLLDEAVVASLEADAAALVDQLAEVERSAAALVPELDALTANEAALDADHGGEPVDLDDLGARAQEMSEAAATARATLAGAEAEVAALERESAQVAARFAELEAKVTERAGRLAAAEETRAGFEAALAPAAAAAGDAAAARDEAQTHHDEAVAALDLARSDQRAAASRVEALSEALEQARASAGAARLKEVGGVLGTLLDLVEIDPGWEAAVEVALGEALRAVVVDDVNGARAALRALIDGDRAGAVLPLPSGTIPAGVAVGELPSSVTALRPTVRGRGPGVDMLLDRLLAGAVHVARGWEVAVEVAAERRDLVVVTDDGCRFDAGGWRTGADPTGATGAALDAARSVLAHATSTSASASAVAERTTSELAVARLASSTAESEARRIRDELTSATTHCDRLSTELASITEARQVAAGETVDLDVRLAQARERSVALSEAHDRARSEADDAARRVDAARSVEHHRAERRRAVAALRNDIEVRAAGLEQRRALLVERQTAVEARLSRYVDERREAERRRLGLVDDLNALDRMRSVLEHRSRRIGELLDEARERQRRRNDAARDLLGRIDALRADRTEQENQLDADRERKRRAELDAQESRLRIETLTTALRTELDADTDEAVNAPAPELPPGTTPSTQLAELERELRSLGPINPLALQEHTELTERETFLADQLDDVRASRRELSRVIAAVDHEIVAAFGLAFSDVAENFTRLFETLFPGGSGALSLTDPGDLLGTGIEIEARPSGKNVRKLSLLSGGERSLTALAFLFSVFRSRPSPFYVMDEVEAALDDMNLARFLNLVDDFRTEAQLLLVSHQKRTMEAGDALIGVSMQPGGSSKVVSEKTSRV